jgi:hypothetical protein
MIKIDRYGGQKCGLCGHALHCALLNVSGAGTRTGHNIRYY